MPRTRLLGHMVIALAALMLLSRSAAAALASGETDEFNGQAAPDFVVETVTG